MKPQILALIAAAAWGIGGFFEKKGLHAAQLSPQVGITLRTLVAALLLSAISASEWRTVSAAGWKSLSWILLGGGVLAGTVGMLCFYAAIKDAPLGRVMPIAFTAPLFGALMGILFLSEPLSLRTLAGIALTVGGIVLLTFR